MAYNKKNWQDNVSDITAAELNRIEQGIYDNSIVIDAVTNTLNPTDTETYKTAELTEGQITDVIGVSDIIIKGQTEQDGTPTPSAPVDVNVVSGSNVINTSSKNLFDKDTEIKGKLIVTTTGAIQNNSAWNISQFIPVKSGTELCFSYQTQGSGQIELVEYDKNQNILGGEAPSITQKYTKTISNNTKFVRVGYRNDLTCDNLQLEYGSNRTTYEPHQGKELPLDLPVENLCPTSSMSTINEGYINASTGNLGSVIAGKTYTLSFKNNSGYTANIALRIIYDNTYSAETSANLVANGLVIYTFTASHSGTVALSGKVEKDVTNIFTQLQLEQGLKANAYTPYGTDPIELCKIGNYQDYFYKSGSKWHLHKEIGKVVLDGSESDFSTVGSSGSYYRISLLNVNNIKNFGSQRTTNIFINNFSKSTVDNYNSVFQYEDDIYFYLPEGMSTKQAFVDLLSSTNSVLYYVLNNATETEITDTTLISQLKAIYNAPLYKQTNITQTNNDLPMVLDITACKDNINGMKAFIRK